MVRSIKRREDLNFWFSVAEPEKAQFSHGTFDALADDWLGHGECVREISKSCLINYRSHLHNHIRPVIGKIPLRDLELKHVEALAIELKSKRPQTRSYTSVRKNRLNDDFFEDDEFLSMAYRREILTVACMMTLSAASLLRIHLRNTSSLKLPNSLMTIGDWMKKIAF